MIITKDITERKIELDVKYINISVLLVQAYRWDFFMLRQNIQLNIESGTHECKTTIKNMLRCDEPMR